MEVCHQKQLVKYIFHNNINVRRGMKYELYRGESLLGIIVHETDDFPTHKGTFYPSGEFDDIASLFEKEIRLLESGNLEEWQLTRTEIDRPVITLKPVGGGKIILNPLIHIEGKEVWWR